MAAIRRILLPALAAALLLPAAAQPGEDNPPGRSPDVLLTFRVGNTGAGGEDAVRTYELLAGTGPHKTQLTQGFRVPIPTTSFNTRAVEGAAMVPVTSFTYQNVGFMVDARVRIVGPDRIHVTAQIEDSHLAAREALDGQPMIATVSQTLDVVLATGKTHRVTRVDDPSFGSMFLEITAAILD